MKMRIHIHKGGFGADGKTFLHLRLRLPEDVALLHPQTAHARALRLVGFTNTPNQVWNCSA